MIFEILFVLGGGASGDFVDPFAEDGSWLRPPNLSKVSKKWS